MDADAQSVDFLGTLRVIRPGERGCSVGVQFIVCVSHLPHCPSRHPITYLAEKGRHRYSHFSHSFMVYIPGISKTLYRRKGGGKGGGSGSSSGGGKSGSTSGTTIPKDFGGLPMGKTSVTAYGYGGGKVSTIPSGMFTGRTVGGGSRDNVFGTRSVWATFFSTR